MTEIAKCEGCEQEKDVKDIEGHLLCDECADDIVRCSFCNQLLAITYNDLETNAGPLVVPTLSLPDKEESLIFCDVCCLEEYIQKYRRERNVLEKAKEMKMEQDVNKIKRD